MRHIASLWNGCNPETQNSGKMKHEGAAEAGMFSTPFFIMQEMSQDDKLACQFDECRDNE